MNPAAEKGLSPSGKDYAAQWLSRQEAGPIPREAPRTQLIFLLTPSVPKTPSDIKAVEMVLVQALTVSFLNY